MESIKDDGIDQWSQSGEGSVGKMGFFSFLLCSFWSESIVLPRQVFLNVFLTYYRSLTAGRRKLKVTPLTIFGPSANIKHDTSTSASTLSHLQVLYERWECRPPDIIYN